MAQMNSKGKKINPFPGLRPFNPEENDFFFGRENECEEIKLKLINNNFVAVLGASAEGKSSLVKCGLPARLKKHYSDKKEWKVISVKPGNDLLRNLATELVKDFSAHDQREEETANILNNLKINPDGIISSLEKLSVNKGVRILFIVDQFEELFRYRSIQSLTDYQKELTQFIELITHTASSGQKDLFTVIAVRSDFISECAHYKKLAQLINKSNYLIPKMNLENFRKIIEEPLMKTGISIDPDLVETIIYDVYDRQDYLPVVQHALMKSWERWAELDEPDKPLSYAEYESIGTVKDSISRHANSIFEELSPPDKKICEKLFKTITGKGPDNKGISYPMTVRSIAAALECPVENLTQVINKYRDPSVSFLIPGLGFPLDEDSIVELSHESLTHLWDRLNMWINEEAESVQMYLRLSEASELYQQGKSTLLKQPDLQLALDWREKNKPSLPWAMKYNPAYERAMVYLRTSEKEFLESEERKTKQNKLRFKRIKIISSILGGIVILTTITIAAMIAAKASAERRFKEAERQKSEVAAQKKMADQFATLALKKSIESDSLVMDATKKAQREQELKVEAQKYAEAAKRESSDAKRESRVALIKAKDFEEQKIEMSRKRMVSLAKSMSLRSLQISDQADLQSLLAYQAYLFNNRNGGQSNDADIYQGLYNVAKQKGSSHYKAFRGHEGRIKGLAFIPGRNEFCTSGADGKILRWNLDNSDKTYQVLYSDSEVFGVLAISPSADWLACGGQNAGIKMIPLNGNGSEYDLRGHSGEIKSLIFSYDGKYLYSAALDGKVLKWDLSAKTSVDLSTGLTSITSIDLSTDNKYLAGIGADGKALIWNPEAVSDNLSITKEGKTIKALKFKPAEEKIAVGYDDGTVELWDIPSRQIIASFKAHSGNVSNIRFNSKPLQIATSGSEGLLKMWDPNDLTAMPVTFNDNGGLILTFDFSSDGQIIVSGVVTEKNNIIARPTLADTFAADGCLYVTRNFTPEEWLTYIGKDIEYEKTCSEKDHSIKIREIR